MRSLANRNLFAFRGFSHSGDRADWVQAESEFIHRVPVEILDRLREWRGEMLSAQSARI
jgi:hypothetical protein